MKRKRFKNIGWLANLNLITPKFCRLVARKGNGKTAMTNREIADVAGISVGTVRRLYSLDNWNRVTAEVIHRYTMACGVDLMRPGRTAVKFFRTEKLAYLKKTAGHQKVLLVDKLQKVNNSRGGSQ